MQDRKWFIVTPKGHSNSPYSSDQTFIYPNIDNCRCMDALPMCPCRIVTTAFSIRYISDPIFLKTHFDDPLINTKHTLLMLIRNYNLNSIQLQNDCMAFEWAVNKAKPHTLHTFGTSINLVRRYSGPSASLISTFSLFYLAAGPRLSKYILRLGIRTEQITSCTEMHTDRSIGHVKLTLHSYW